MSGTSDGGIAAAETNKRLYGESFYREIGSKGGQASRTGGFFGRRDLASIAGTLGGSISRRYRSDGTREYVSPETVARKRKEYEKAYEHLLKINRQANR